MKMPTNLGPVMTLTTNKYMEQATLSVPVKTRAKKEMVKHETPDTSPEAMIARAIEKDLDIEKLEKLFALRDKLRAEYAKSSYDAAMAEFQRECPIIEKKTKVDFQTKDKTARVNYSYAEMDEIVKQTKDLIAKNGFSYNFELEEMSTGLKVTCVVNHVDGWVGKGEFTAQLAGTSLMSNAQVMAGKATYGKRQAFCNAFGIVTGDEDVDAIKTKEEAKAETSATPEQRQKIADLAQQLGFTMDEVAKKCRQRYGVSYADITSVQAMGIIEGLTKANVTSV